MRIGIDNGISGGLVALSDYDGSYIDGITMPTTKIGGLNAIDAIGIVGIVRDFCGGESGKIKSITIEACPEHANQSSIMRSMAMSFGIIYGSLSVRFPLTSIRVVRSGNPKDSWQRNMLHGYKKGDTKPMARALAKQLWPDETWITKPRGKTPDMGLVDAALIAEYSRRMKL
jgi:hypothetical protein